MYEERWAEFVDSLELSPQAKGRVRDLLVRSTAHNDELIQLLAADKIDQSQIYENWITEEEIAEALQSFLPAELVRDYLNEHWKHVGSFAEDMLAWQSQKFLNREVGILEASGLDNLSLVRTFIEQGVDLNMVSLDGSETPLLNAVSHKNSEMAQLLLANGADPNLSTMDEFLVTPIDAAVSKGDIQMIRLLVENGADIEKASNGWVPLETAAFRGRTKAVAELLALGADATSQAGSKALSWAIRYDDIAIEQMLIKAGAMETNATKHARLAQAARRKNGI